jgi:hypothetical protein
MPYPHGFTSQIGSEGVPVEFRRLPRVCSPGLFPSRYSRPRNARLVLVSLSFPPGIPRVHDAGGNPPCAVVAGTAFLATSDRYSLKTQTTKTWLSLAFLSDTRSGRCLAPPRSQSECAIFSLPRNFRASIPPGASVDPLPSRALIGSATHTGAYPATLGLGLSLHSVSCLRSGTPGP